MPPKHLIICLLLVLALTVGCDVLGPEAPLSYAAAMLQCGPADEGFTRIVLASEPVTSAEAAYPSVQVVIGQSVRDLAGQKWDITTDMGPGAWYITGPGKFQNALSGTVTVTVVDSTDTVEGSLALRFPSRFVATGFTAPWINNGMLCN